MSFSVPYNPPDPWANEFLNQPNTSSHSQRPLHHESNYTINSAESSIRNQSNENSSIPSLLQSADSALSPSHSWKEVRRALDDDFDPHRKDTVTLKVKPEKEGIFMFRHISYTIEILANSPHQSSALPPDHSASVMQESSMNSSTSGEGVSRRYSEFVWLQNHLHIKYPCRMIPILPPKSLTVDGKYLSADASFLERRRKGLVRFLNNLLAHPLLAEDDLVKKFIALNDSQFLNWKKNTQMNNIKDEFKNRVIPQDFIQNWTETGKTEPWPILRQEIIDACDIFTHLTILVDKIVKRIEESSSDLEKLSYWIQSSIRPLSKLYSFESEPVPLMTHGLGQVKTSLDDQAQILKDQSRGYAIGILEDAKRMLSSLTSVKRMVERVEREIMNMTARTSLLKERISTCETQLSKLESSANRASTDSNLSSHEQRGKTGTKDYLNEIIKLQESIAQDKAEIGRIINREWLVRECVGEEMRIFQKTQFAISRIVKEIVSEQVKYSELLSNDWSNLDHKVSEMPLE